jgi:hypothetical protein
MDMEHSRNRNIDGMTVTVSRANNDLLGNNRATSYALLLSTTIKSGMTIQKIFLLFFP